jgi:microcin C transport system substrate-binding protein
MDVMFVAFTAGKIDFWNENQSKRWATGYDLPQIKSGQIIKESLPNATPQGIQAYFFNLRLAKFSDVRVREAIGLLFDFETIRRTVLFDQYTRTKTFFPNSDYGAIGEPTSAEIAILTPYADTLKPEILNKAFEPSRTDGSGRIRNQIRKALRLFKSAGWNFVKGKLINGNGEQLSIEFLIHQPSSERIIAPFIQNLKKIGIAANLRLVDTSQYENRTDNFDFDILSTKLNFFPPPGPELRSYYGTQEADVKGSANMAGIKNPVIDSLIEKIIAAKDFETLKATTRAMDRVLLWNHYVIPQFHNDIDRVAYWNKFSRPEKKPKYSIGFPSTWWIDINKEMKLQ